MLRGRLSKFAVPDAVQGGKHITLALAGYVIAVASLLSLEGLLILPIYLLAALLFVKTLILQHDAGHGSLFKSRRANITAGRLCSLFTLVPFESWRREHNAHHGHFAKIDQRTNGDILLLTTDEYEALGRRDKLLYRVQRHPFYLIAIAPFLYFLIRCRISMNNDKGSKRSVLQHNICLGLFYGGLLCHFGGPKTIIVFLPIWYIAGVIGVAIFLVQHQSPAVRWYASKDWGFEEACQFGCSSFQAPAPLQWVFGNVGYHHLHHMNPKIPSYRLADCYDAMSEYLLARNLSLTDLVQAFQGALWSPGQNRIIRFKDLA